MFWPNSYIMKSKYFEFKQVDYLYIEPFSHKYDYELPNLPFKVNYLYGSTISDQISNYFTEIEGCLLLRQMSNKVRI